MAVLYVAIPVALVIVGVAIAGFVWAVRSGQMDDLETPAMRILDDDGDVLPSERRERSPRERDT